MKISKTVYQALAEAIRLYQIETGTHATVNENFCIEGARTWSVNFCASGHMTSQDARTFANEINHAALIVDAINSMKLEVLHEESTYITNAESWNKTVEAMKASLEGCRINLIEIVAEIHFEEQYIRMYGENK